MRRIMMAVVLFLALAACSDDEIKGSDKLNKNGGVPGNFYEVEVNGLPCIVWMEKKGAAETSYAYSGLTCDWGLR